MLLLVNMVSPQICTEIGFNLYILLNMFWILCCVLPSWPGPS